MGEEIDVLNDNVAAAAADIAKRRGQPDGPDGVAVQRLTPGPKAAPRALPLPATKRGRLAVPE